MALLLDQLPWESARLIWTASTPFVFSQHHSLLCKIPFEARLTISQGLNATIIGGPSFASALALAFITTSTKDDWDLPVSFFVTFPAQYLPYLFILITLLCRGPQVALKQASGFFGAHLYDFLTGLYPAYGGPNRNLLPTPEFLKKMWGTRAEVQRPYGTALAAASTPAKPAWGIGLGSWGQWGPGHRLGGDAEAGVIQQQGNGRKIIVLAGVAFVLIACGLGVLFMMHRDPEGWWTTLWGALLGGDMSGTTFENEGLQSEKGN